MFIMFIKFIKLSFIINDYKYLSGVIRDLFECIRVIDIFYPLKLF